MPARRPMVECTEVDILLFGSRRCPRCGRDLAANEDFFVRDSSRRDGLTSSCRDCRNEESRRSTRRDRRRRREEAY